LTEFASAGAQPPQPGFLLPGHWADPRKQSRVTRGPEAAREVAADNPAVTEFASGLAASPTAWGCSTRRRGGPRRRAELSGSAADPGPAGGRQPRHPRVRRGLDLSHGNLGNFYQNTGRVKEAEQSTRRPAAAGQAGGRPSHVTSSPASWPTATTTGMAYQATRRWQGGGAEPSRRAADSGPAGGRQPRGHPVRRSLAAATTTWDLYQITGRPGEAEQSSRSRSSCWRSWWRQPRPAPLRPHPGQQPKTSWVTSTTTWAGRGKRSKATARRFGFRSGSSGAPGDDEPCDRPGGHLLQSGAGVPRRQPPSGGPVPL